jgi:hypothetical protein
MMTLTSQGGLGPTGMASIFMARSIIVQCDTKVPGVIGSGRGGSKAGGFAPSLAA